MSLNFNDIKKYYPTLWDEKKVLMAVEKGKITEAQFEEITGKSIYEIGSLEEGMIRKQERNKKALASFLANSTVTWTDGCKYGVTEEDQTEMSLNLSKYQLQVTAGISDAILEWHPKHAACRNFTIEEFTGLILAITDFVYPHVQKCQKIKEQIYAATSYEELKAIDITY